MSNIDENKKHFNEQFVLYVLQNWQTKIITLNSNDELKFYDEKNDLSTEERV